MGKRWQAMSFTAIEESGGVSGRHDRAFADRSPIPGLSLTPSAPRPPPRQILCEDLAMRIARDGTWHYQGSPIRRKELVCLFSSCVQREADGSFWIVTPAERGEIVVEDAPFIAVELFVAMTDKGRQDLTFRTNVDQMVTAGPANPIRVAYDLVTCHPTPYLTIRPGAGRLPVEARINRAVYYELAALSVNEPVHGAPMQGVWSSGAFFPLGSADEA